MPLQHTNSIDLIALDPNANEVVLGMTELRPWDGSDRRVYELQEKVNAYLSFALDGEMEENLPQLAGKGIRLQLDCVEEPDAKTNHFLSIIRRQIGFQGIQFHVRVAPELANAAAHEHECCGGHGGGCSREAEPAHGHEHPSGQGCGCNEPASEPGGATGCCGGASGGCGCA